ncbi:ABC1 kinase family protein [Sphingomonas sp. MMS12-HWE2-04]|uniref:ABC1 kinase family protein n=1 Tax=Sphingomonas sp. MMS12-HWE2-04 TaxID=3234199 RepID=UPI003850AA0D
MPIASNASQVFASSFRALGNALGTARRGCALIFWTVTGLLAFAARNAANARQAYRKPSKVIAAEELVLFARRAGGAWAKILQILSTRRDVVSEDAAAILATVTQQVGGREPPNVHRRIADHLQFRGVDVQHLSIQPIASGSIAFVYKITAAGLDFPLALKLRRPGIIRTLARDFALLGHAANLLRRFPALAHLPLPAMARSFSETIERQSDFSLEAAYIARFGDKFARSNCRIARVIPALSSEDMLFMAFEEERFEIDSVTPRFGIGAYQNLVRCVYEMIFVHGLFHCDVHPGNVFFDARGNALFLDLGIVKEITEDEREDLADFFLCIALNRGKRAADTLLAKATTIPPGIDRAQFRREIADVVRRSSGLKAGQFSAVSFVVQLFDVMRSHGIVGTADFIWMIAVLVTLEGPVKAAYPDLDFQRIAVDVITASRGVPVE